MIAYLAALDEAGVTAAALATHRQWARARTLEDHVARSLETVRRADGWLTYAGLRDGAELVCTLARHELSLATPSGHLDAVGIGAVFTPEPHRGRGHAHTLLRRVMADAARSGRRAVLLFSDIGAAFYEGLGFRALSHVTWTARTASLSQRPVRLEPTDDAARLCALYEASWPEGEWLRVRRTPARWRYWAWRNDAGASFFTGDDGYVTARRLGDGSLWVDDAVHLGPRPEPLWAAFATLARELGATRVSGWLRPEQAGGPFVAVQRDRCVPMLAATSLDDARSHFASVDRF